MKARLDFDAIAKGLGAARGGPVRARSGYFGAAQLAAELTARLRVPASGGRPTDPAWTERRLVPLAPATLRRLEALAAALRAQGAGDVQPLQPAALLLEKTTEQLSNDDIAGFVRPRRATR